MIISKGFVLRVLRALRGKILNVKFITTATLPKLPLAMEHFITPHQRKCGDFPPLFV